MLARCFAAAALAALAAACGNTAAPGEGGANDAAPAAKRVVGASLLTQKHEFYQDMVAAMQEAAGEHGIDLRVQYAEFDLRTQNDQLELFTAQGVDAIILAPADSSGVAPAVADARAAGIPVFTVDIAAKGADVVAHIASDNHGGGRALAKHLVEELLPEPQGKVAVIDHPAVESVQQRTAGFVEVIDAQPGLAIAARVPGEGQRDKAHQAAQDLVEAHPDLAAIFGINDDSALGALAAVEEAGLQDRIVVVGFDGTDEARKAIAEGTALKADAVQYPKKIGARAVAIVAQHLAGESVPAEVAVETGIIDQTTLNAENAS